MEIGRGISKHRFAIAVLAFLIVSNFIWFSVNVSNSQKQARLSKQYPFLSKRVFIENQNDVLVNFVPLRDVLRKYVNSAGTPLGLYFEYLPSGTSIGINDGEPFFAASLLKLPVAMKTYKLIEEGKLQKDQQVTIEARHLDKGFGTVWQRGAGSKLTVEEVLDFAISESDNTADKILRDLIKPRPVSDVFDYLDIPTDVTVENGAGITPKNFSSVLKALYLSSYLTFTNSNELLNTMTTSPYNDRLVAGVPKDIKVAHKVGIYKNPTTGNQVHSDCGIVYAPKRPYILCIMSGAELNIATTQMKDISKTVYDYVSGAN